MGFIGGFLKVGLPNKTRWVQYMGV